MIRCIPCPAPVRHFAHHFHHHALRPIGRHVHHVAHHTPRIIAYGCCVAAIGGMGGALVAPPGGFFPAPSASYAPDTGGGGVPGAGSAGGYGGSQGWPEMPAYSGSIGGVGGIGGGGAVLIPTYSNTHPSLLSVPPNVLRGGPPIAHTTSVPEPSSFALLLVPVVALPILRRIG